MTAFVILILVITIPFIIMGFVILSIYIKYTILPHLDEKLSYSKRYRRLTKDKYGWMYNLNEKKWSRLSKFYVEYENLQHIESAIEHMIERGEVELTHGETLKESRSILKIKKTKKERSDKLNKLLDE